MPTKFTLHKWLCNECALLCDTEPECHVHEREMHQPMDLRALEQICTRIDHGDCVDLLDEYERVCHAMLTKVIESRLKKAGNYGISRLVANESTDANDGKQKSPLDNAHSTIFIGGRVGWDSCLG